MAFKLPQFAFFACIASASLTLVAPPASYAKDVTYTFNIPAQDLGSALRAFANASLQQVVFDSAVVQGKRSSPLVGSYGPDEGIRTLLGDSGLIVRRTDSGVLVIEAPESQRQGAASPTRLDDASQASPSGTELNKSPLEEIVVTGTHIRGVTDTASPVRVIGRSFIDQSGATTVTQLMSTAPENFGGGITQDTSTAAITTQHGDLNRGRATGVNLRGLGSDSTLVLLDGIRLPTASSGYSVDISAIPLAAIDHVDILKDGASSIYGSDAVAGVVNFNTSRSFDGAQTQVTLGGVTSGSKFDEQVNQTFGKVWSTGHILGSYTYDHQDSLNSSSRPATADAVNPSDIIPDTSSHSFLLAGRQDIGENLSIGGDFLFSNKDVLQHTSFVDTSFTVGNPFHDSLLSQDQYIVSSLEANYSISSDWSVTATANYGSSETQYTLRSTDPDPSFSFLARYHGHDVGGEVRLNGSLIDIPGGSVRLATGVSIRSETYAFTQAQGIVGTVPLQQAFDTSRTIKAVYAELFVPIVGEPNEIPFVHRLELTASDREENYSDFGSTNNPKVGLLWSPNDEITTRATYSTSFRAPLLVELSADPTLTCNCIFRFPDPQSPTGRSLQLFQLGSNPNLKPQTARSFTAGFDYQPSYVPGLKVGISGFDIMYSNRIDNPSASPLLLEDPGLYATFITRNPSPALLNQLASSPLFKSFGRPLSGVVAVVDDRLQNVGSVHVSGLDLDTSYSRALGSGTLTAGVDASYFLEYKASLPGTQVSRINTPYYPTRWKLRGDLGWQSERWSVHAALNYVNGYTDNRDPSQLISIGSFTTVDTQLIYNLEVPTETDHSSSQIRLSIINLFDKQPPFVLNANGVGSDAGGFNYDPANANILGRFISLTLTKRW